MEIQKVFVNPNGGTAVLKCPHCGNEDPRSVQLDAVLRFKAEQKG